MTGRINQFTIGFQHETAQGDVLSTVWLKGLNHDVWLITHAIWFRYYLSVLLTDFIGLFVSLYRLSFVCVSHWIWWFDNNFFGVNHQMPHIQADSRGSPTKVMIPSMHGHPFVNSNITGGGCSSWNIGVVLRWYKTWSEVWHWLTISAARIVCNNRCDRSAVDLRVAPKTRYYHVGPWAGLQLA